MVMPVGIVINDGVLLIDHIKKLCSSGKRLRDAVVEAAAVRFRLILMYHCNWERELYNVFEDITLKKTFHLHDDCVTFNETKVFSVHAKSKVFLNLRVRNLYL